MLNVSVAQSAPAASERKPFAPRQPVYTPVLVSGGGNDTLVRAIADVLDTAPLELGNKQFADGEIYVRLKQTVRGKDVFLVQPTCPPVNDNFVRLCLMIDAITRASARELTLVMPYFGYGRQDQIASGREANSAAWAARTICNSGRVDRIVTLDLHTPKIQGFFDPIPGDHFYSTIPMTDWIRQHWMDGGRRRIAIASPDVGGVERARAYAKRLDVPYVIVDKLRTAHSRAEAKKLVGRVKDKSVIIIDDMIDTAGTIKAAAEFLLEKGAVKVNVAATHALLSGEAIAKLGSNAITAIAVTDTIAHPREKLPDKIQVLSTAPFFAEAIRRIFNAEELSDMVGFLKQIK